MSTFSSAQDESRSNTIGDAYATETSRRARFPSLHLDAQEFADPGWNGRLPGEEALKLTVAERVWYWLCGISRKVWLIAAGIAIAVLSIVIVGVILLFVLPKSDSNVNPQPQLTTTEAPLPTPTTTKPSAIPYPKIYNTGTESKWFEIGWMESVLPDTRGYEFRNRLIAFSNTTSYLLLNSTQWLPLSNISQPSDCSGCKLLSATDTCLLGGDCSSKDNIFCCESCGKISQVCLLHGSSIVTPGAIIEWRISTDGDQLLLTNAYELGPETIIQTVRANDTIFFQNGPFKMYSIPAKSPISSLTIDPNDSNQTDLVVWLNSTGFLNLQYQQQTFFVELQVTEPLLSLDTIVFDNYGLIVLLEGKHYQVVRFNFVNHCISISPPLTYYFDGDLMGSFWAEDQYFLWYNDIRGSEGVLLVRLSFSWPDDSVCPYLT